MADSTPSGWLPPRAPGAGPPPRFDTPYEPPAPREPTGPTFAPPAAAKRGQRNGAAVWALVLGIVGLTLLVLSLGSLFVLTLPCSIASWVLARRAHGKIAQGRTAHGDGQATAALWLGRIGVIAGVAAMVVFFALLASGFDFEQFRDDLERELDRRRERERNDGGAEGVRASVEHLRAVLAVWPAR